MQRQALYLNEKPSQLDLFIEFITDYSRIKMLENMKIKCKSTHYIFYLINQHLKNDYYVMEFNDCTVHIHSIVNVYMSNRQIM